MADGWVVGFHPVLAALESGRPADAVWVQRERRDQRTRRIVRAARDRGLPLSFVPRTRLDEVAAGVPHNGCAVRIAPVGFVELEAVVAAEGVPSRILVVDHVVDPHNLGALVRTAAGLGLDAVILAGPSAPPLGGAVAKAAAGQLERVPLVRATVAADALAVLRAAGYWVFGAEAGGAPLPEVRVVGRWVLCVGSEEHGVRAKTRSQVDEWVAVPMAAGVESLNVSVAAGILLYTLSQQ